ncbi:MAG: hypothetical protein ACXWV6_12925 [Chitinophagaceae bacterium]
MDSRRKQSKKAVNGSGVGAQFQPSQSLGPMEDTKTGKQPGNTGPKRKEAKTVTKQNNSKR